MDFPRVSYTTWRWEIWLSKCTLTSGIFLGFMQRRIQISRLKKTKTAAIACDGVRIRTGTPTKEKHVIKSYAFVIVSRYKAFVVSILLKRIEGQFSTQISRIFPLSFNRFVLLAWFQSLSRWQCCLYVSIYPSCSRRLGIAQSPKSYRLRHQTGGRGFLHARRLTTSIECGTNLIKIFTVTLHGVSL